MRSFVFQLFSKKRTYADVLLWTLNTTLADNPGNDPIPVFSHLVAELRRRHPNFGYLHAVEPRVRGSFDRTVEEESNDFLRAIWAGKLWISAGGFSRDDAMKQADEHGELIAFGRYFTSNVCFISVIPPLSLISSHAR